MINIDDKDFIRKMKVQAGQGDQLQICDVTSGRRFRVFYRLIYVAYALDSIGISFGNNLFTKILDYPSEARNKLTYEELYNRVRTSELTEYKHIRDMLQEIPIIHVNVKSADPELSPCLQDLGYEINQDIQEACFALDNPDLFYPGIDDESIPPVSDEHVEKVIVALQRELTRERRRNLPPVQLEELPFRIKRALAERRRFRYKQYGITTEQWKKGYFSLWEVDEDLTFVPRKWILEAEKLKAMTQEVRNKIPSYTYEDEILRRLYGSDITTDTGWTWYF